uniref:Uncharacterized protein n=2 Tax=Odontella aurita TaxID=265563 RepID=A0A7S4MX39_9STRA|mmetsp:Transcript_37965/g.113404  ORF Transcript_37965/g.113404 Transcript_37965/m.113404 type:complete len:733 (+) Transcript_37965:126-2324(+)
MPRLFSSCSQNRRIVRSEASGSISAASAPQLLRSDSEHGYYDYRQNERLAQHAGGSSTVVDRDPASRGNQTGGHHLRSSSDSNVQRGGAPPSSSSRLRSQFKRGGSMPNMGRLCSEDGMTMRVPIPDRSQLRRRPVQHALSADSAVRSSPQMRRQPSGRNVHGGGSGGGGHHSDDGNGNSNSSAGPPQRRRSSSSRHLLSADRGGAQHQHHHQHHQQADYSALLPRTIGDPIPGAAGVYRVVAESVEVQSCADGYECSDKAVGTLSVGTYAPIAEVRKIPDVATRGRLAGGFGWVTLEDHVTDASCLRRIMTGTYQVTCMSVAISRTASRSEEGGSHGSSERTGTLGMDEYIDISDVRLVQTEGRVRGRLASGEGWITIVDTAAGRECARAVPLGAYKTLAQTIETRHARKDSKVIDKLDPGCLVQVVQTQFVPNDKRVRARLSTGGWISLIDTAHARLAAVPFPPGAYRGASSSSKSSRIVDPFSTPGWSSSPVHAGACVEVIETSLTKNDMSVRGRLASGGYVEIEHEPPGPTDLFPAAYPSRRNTKFAKEKFHPVHVGVYYVTAERLDAHKTAETTILRGGVSREADVVGTFPKMTPVEVAETVYLHRERRVRGRLATGQWITIVDCGPESAADIPSDNPASSAAATPLDRAKPLKLGRYETGVEQLVVCRGVRTSSGKWRRMYIRERFEVVETRMVRSDQRIRVRRAEGGWVSLINTSDNKQYAKKCD